MGLNKMSKGQAVLSVQKHRLGSILSGVFGCVNPACDNVGARAIAKDLALICGLVSYFLNTSEKCGRHF